MQIARPKGETCTKPCRNEALCGNRLLEIFRTWPLALWFQARDLRQYKSVSGFSSVLLASYITITGLVTVTHSQRERPSVGRPLARGLDPRGDMATHAMSARDRDSTDLRTVRDADPVGRTGETAENLANVGRDEHSFVS